MFTIKQETAEVLDLIHYVNTQAFGNPLEADLVNILSTCSMLPISQAAIQSDIAAGHIAFSPAVIKRGISQLEIIALAP